MSLSYNGGKDCLVLLILFLCALGNYKKSALPTALQSVHIISPHPFAEVNAFVAESSKMYKLDLRDYGMPMKEAFKKYLEDRKNVKAILVGTRRTDPHGQSLTHFDQTDKGWPAFMRIHPVIDWHYAEIWAVSLVLLWFPNSISDVVLQFIRHFEIPYCSLYDRGYTSLGGTTDTHPNPALKAADGVKNNDQTFLPAYVLLEDKAERLGRDW